MSKRTRSEVKRDPFEKSAFDFQTSVDSLMNSKKKLNLKIRFYINV